jgi:RNA polymerase sigma factor (sigma-70 family)
VDAAQRNQVQEAMTALAEGDRSAFQPVFTALWAVLVKFCDRTLHDQDLAQDAAQAALMKVLLHATEFQPERDAIAWALGFAAFECLSLRNRNRRRREQRDMALLATVPGGAPSPEDAAIREDLRAAAAEAVGTLRPRDVETLDLAFSGERRAASGPAFRKRLQRALARLRTAWRHTHGSPD